LVPEAPLVLCRVNYCVISIGEEKTEDRLVVLVGGAFGSPPKPRPLGLCTGLMGSVMPWPSFPSPPSPVNPMDCIMGVALVILSSNNVHSLIK